MRLRACFIFVSISIFEDYIIFYRGLNTYGFNKKQCTYLIRNKIDNKGCWYNDQSFKNQLSDMQNKYEYENVSHTFTAFCSLKKWTL